MSTSASSKELGSLLKRLRESHSGAATAVMACPGGTATGPRLESVGLSVSSLDPDEPMLGHLLYSFMLWESTTPKALAAMKKIEAAVVDFNELRHCMPDELSTLIGERYPCVAERALRLRSVLGRVYAAQHRMSLSHLAGLGASEARSMLENFEGMPGFVAARVCLLGLGGHTMPVDSRLCRRLVEAKVVADGTESSVAAAALERKLKPTELPEAYALLQAWADDGTFGPAPSHLDGLVTTVRPVVDRAAREQARKAAARDRAKTKRSKLAKASKRKPGKRA